MADTHRKLETLDDLKAAIQEHREEGRKIIRHFKRLEDEYSDWEDRLVEIEKSISQAEEDLNLTKEEIIKPKEVDDIFGEIFN